MTRLRVKNKCIFGAFLGYTDETKKKVRFLDEETNEIVVYKSNRVEKTYDKWN